MAVDTCPERMDAADAEAPPRIEMAVRFWSGMGVETAVLRRMQATVVNKRFVARAAL